MDTNNQFEFITQYLKKENIEIDLNEFKFQIETHPDFPSLLSFSEALNFFRIDNVAAKIAKNQIDQLPNNFVALLQTKENGQFLSFVERQKESFKYSTGKYKVKVSKEIFLDIWQEVILLVEKTDAIIASKPKTSLFLGLLFTLFGLLFITILVLTSHLNFKAITILLMLAGVYLAVEALKQEFGVKSTFSAAFCGSNSTSYQSNCESVITSKKAKLFSNYGLSDLGIVFFAGHLFVFFLMSIAGLIPQFNKLSLLVLLSAIPITFFSIYYQLFVEKKWCPVCLMIIAVLYIELGFYTFYSHFNFNTLNLFSVSVFLFGFISSLLTWVAVKPYISKYFELKSSEIASIRFKRNYNLFKLALKDSTKIDYQSLKSVLSVGNSDAKIKISIVTNPFCGYCVEAHKILEDVLQRYSNQVQLNIRFNFNNKLSDENSKNLHYKLVQTYFEKGEKAFMEALGVWFKNKDIDKWFTQFGKGKIDTETEQILTIQNKQNQENKLTFTPAIVVGEYLYPKAYDRSELYHFISELTEDDAFLIKEGEAKYLILNN